jgi:hypothetical protein
MTCDLTGRARCGEVWWLEVKVTFKEKIRMTHKVMGDK